MFRAVCTAFVERGSVTNRVDRVVSPKRDAVDLIARAEKIKNAPMFGPNQETGADRRRAPAQDRDARVLGFVTTCISMYPDDLARLDAMLERLRAAGIRDISRSKLIRIALRRLDVDALAGELLGVT